MRLNRNKALAMLASFIILTTAIGVGVWSAGFPATVTIRPESVLKNASFNVGFDGTYYYAINGSTGEMLLQSTNLTYVVDMCIGNLTASGGTIYLNQLTVPGSVTYGANILITQDYAGHLSYFSNNHKIYSIEDGILDAAVWTDLKAKGYFWNYENRTDTLAYPVSTASYTISQVLTYTYMKNGSTGQIDYSGTNVSKVFQFAVSNLTVGGLVFVKNGTYYFENTVTIAYDDVKIEGEGTSTILSPAKNIPIFKVSPTWRIEMCGISFKDFNSSLTSAGFIYINNDAGGMHFLKFHDLYFQSGYRGIYTDTVGSNNLGYCIFENLHFESPKSTVLFLTSSIDERVTGITVSVNVAVDQPLFYKTNPAITSCGAFWRDITVLRIDDTKTMNGMIYLNYTNEFTLDNVIFDSKTNTVATGHLLELHQSSRNTFSNLLVWSSHTDGIRLGKGCTLNYFDRVILNNNLDYGVNDLTELTEGNSFANLQTENPIGVAALNLTAYDFYSFTFEGDVAAYSYLIYAVGSNYFMRNGSTSHIDYYSTNATKVEQFAVGNLTTSGGMVWLKEIQHNTSLTLDNKVLVIESFNGTLRSWSNQGKGFLLSRLAADPDTSGWGDAEAPYWWYNSVEDTIKYWNGTGVVIIPSIGGGSASTYTLSYDYTVYKTGSTYYAEKYDGTIGSSGTNATIVIQYAFDNGNSVFIRSGSYSIKQLVPKSWLTVEGAGQTTQLYVASGTNTDVFRTTATIQGFQIRNLQLHGNSDGNTAGNLFNLTKPRKCIFENLWIYNASDYVFFLSGTAGDYGYYNKILKCEQYTYARTGFLFARWCDENTIAFNTISMNQQYGLNLWAGLNHIIGNSFIQNPGVDIYVGYEDGDVIEGNTFDGGSTPLTNKGRGVYVDTSACEGTKIIGNDFFNIGNVTFSTIYVNAAGETLIQGNTFRGTAVPKYVVEIDGAKNFTMTSNIFDSGYTTSVFYQTGTITGLLVRDNVGFLSENVVASAALSFATAGTYTVTIAHGLSVTPTRNDCIAYIVGNGTADSAYGFISCIESTDATNVVVQYRVSGAATGSTKYVYVRIQVLCDWP